MCNTKLLLLSQPLLIFALLVNLSGFSQIRWDGEAGDGQWTTAANWAGNIVPSAGDDVILDNFFVNGSYIVSLPAGNLSVQIKSISITPDAGKTIELVLPVTNTAIPAFKVSGMVYGMTIGEGGIFRNSSGAGNGQPVEISDSLKINNGGRFVQNCRRSHAAIVTVLSKAPGTEEGIFEFDVPAASSTVSMSGRTYGKLLFSSTAMNGAVSYTGTGINGAIVNSDLETAPGVTLTLNLSDTLFIGRDLIQQGGTINLGNSSRTLITAVGRHLVQSATGIICETGSAFPQIIFNGNDNQQIDCKGIIKDSITIKMNNAAGATLLSPLSLPYMLHLVQGKISTTSENLLTLLSGCGISADSLQANTFIDGPLRKEGLSAAAHFLFPVGKGTDLRWLALKNATGHYTAEFFKSNPQQLSNSYGPGIHHISNMEYWTIRADANPSPSAAIELSFNEPNNGVGTDVSTFRVARLSNGTWVNAGNTAITGTAGTRGSVTGNMLNDFSTETEYFTLAATEASNSPLSINNDRVPPDNRNTGTTGSLQLTYVSSSATPVLTYRADEKKRVQLYITGINGRIVTVITAIPEQGINSLPLPVASLPAGVYVIYAIMANGIPSNVLRFVITR